MTVQELIDKLIGVDNKELTVFGYEINESNIYEILGIDDNLGDRVDINFRID